MGAERARLAPPCRPMICGARWGMLPPMNALRLPAVVAALTAVFTVATAMGACASGPPLTTSDCLVPTMDEVGADGGPDPCHCDPPPDLNVTTCPCLSGNSLQLPYYQACMATYREEIADAGGPIGSGTCPGLCWPGPPDYWTSPQLLWFGPGSGVPPCPAVAPVVAFSGEANGDVALACAITATGTCPGLADICAPGYAAGFSQCVIRPGNFNCMAFSPYNEKHVFSDSSGAPTTFCCLAFPTTQ
jgi:hypothetical protein